MHKSGPSMVAGGVGINGGAVGMDEASGLWLCSQDSSFWFNSLIVCLGVFSWLALGGMYHVPLFGSLGCLC